MEKFKVGDKVYIRRNAARSRNDILGRNKPGARVSVELRTRPIVGKVLQYGGRPIVEYSPTTRTRFTGTLIKQNGYKWDIKSDSGEIYKDVSEADFDLIDSSNAVRSTNAVVAKALNAVARNASGLDGLIADLDSRKYDSINWMPKVIGPGTLYPDGMKFPTGLGYDDEEKVRAAWKSGKYASVVLYKGGSKRGEIPVNAATSTVREKALNAAARNANFRGSVWDRALAVSVRPKFSKGNRVKVVGHPMEDGVRGIVEKTFPSGQVLITTGYDKDGHPYTVQVHQSYLVRNAVVQKAMNAVVAKARNAVTDKSWDGKQLSVGDWVRQKDSGLFGRIVGKYNNYLWNVKWRNGNDTFVEGAAPNDLVFMRHDTTSVNAV